MPDPKTLSAGAAAAGGIVEHAVLLGTPSSSAVKRWSMARRVVSGRLINGYSSSDWLLTLCYRCAQLAPSNLFCVTRCSCFEGPVAGFYHALAWHRVWHGTGCSQATHVAERMSLRWECVCVQDIHWRAGGLDQQDRRPLPDGGTWRGEHQPVGLCEESCRLQQEHEAYSDANQPAGRVR